MIFSDSKITRAETFFFLIIFGTNFLILKLFRIENLNLQADFEWVIQIIFVS